MSGHDLLLTTAFAFAAFLYATVGHAGASGYLAAMALSGMAPAQMKPIALVLNLVVGLIALIQFARAGYFSWRLFWPFALGSVPCALIGGSMTVSSSVYRLLVALCLLAAAVRLMIPVSQTNQRPLQQSAWWIACAWGSVIGLVAGITGTGGGIFLSPLLLLCRWGESRDSGGVAAAFILVNSLAGLIGHQPNLADLPALLPVWAVVVGVCGACGAWLGSRRIAPLLFRRLLALVLVVAVIKLVS
ncbi:MAG: sulfite exporter TauE/SafE family protein [Planctomycetota bacterium]